MTHSGVNSGLIRETELYAKEFLSSVQELEVRLSFPVAKEAKKKKKKSSKKASSTSGNSNEGDADADATNTEGGTTTVNSNEDDTAEAAANASTEGAGNSNQGDADNAKATNASTSTKGGAQKGKMYYLKPNFVSILNVMDSEKKFGPMINLMDGGGKGERFIQEIKPHIKRGIPTDAKNYFTNLTSKVYKTQVMKSLEKRLSRNIDDADTDDRFEMVDLIDAVEALGGEDDMSDSDSDEDLEEAVRDPTPRQTSISEVEDAGMWKKSTIYIYRNEAEFNRAIVGGKPIAGILRRQIGSDGFDFYAVMRIPVKQFGMRKVSFDDTNGTKFYGLWYTDMEIATSNDQSLTCNKFEVIQEAAKMSVVAIPLRYILGKDKPDSNKFCVIANWWKVRNSKGEYVLPTLDQDVHGVYPEEPDVL